MIVKGRMSILLSGAMVSALTLTTAPVQADDAQTEALQRQITAMRQQLQALQDQMTEMKKTAKATPPAAQTVAPKPYEPQKAASYTKAPPSLLPPGVKVTVGGFVEAAGIWRDRNEVADVGSPPFGSLPFPNSPLYHEGELRFSARQSRISLKATGDIDPYQHLQAYYEMDFLGAGVTANSRERNSYQPRIRQAFMTYDNDNYHFHVLAGQAWSLLTQNKVGITPLTENLPLMIDAQYAVGFNW